MKRAAAVLVSLAIAFALAGCGGGSGSGASTSPPVGGSSGSGGSAAITSAADLKAALERSHSDADWYTDVTGVTQETYLGAPVFVIHTTWALSRETDPAVFEAVNTKSQALSDAVGELEFDGLANVAVLHADGQLNALRGTGGVFMNEAFSLPPAATTVEELREWLKKVYGPGGIVKLGPDEHWYEAMEDISTKTEDGKTVVVVKTSLPTWPGDVRSSLIQLALSSTNAPVAAYCSIVAKDGSGTYMNTNPGEPGSSVPFFYPKP
ncbi:MAG: hypothetical protein QMC94_01715 [Anaerosomatales bacterium]|nr:hypothetical protein [Anaerosomatales bacterium]